MQCPEGTGWRKTYVVYSEQCLFVLPGNPVPQEPAHTYCSGHFSLDLEPSKQLVKTGETQ